MFRILRSSIKQTCYGCPTQFEGKTEDGYLVYVRYRYGLLHLDISSFDEGVMVSFERRIGGMLDGILSLVDVVNNTSDWVEWV